ncbi:MAG TPA: YncE family protein [Acidisarcina sp.]|nr:YncE family protein [Acidisarcina sp.]
MLDAKRITSHAVFAAMSALVLMAPVRLPAAESASPYTVQQTWTIGGEGGWDYLTVDSTARLLYIARGPRVQIVNLQTGKLAGEIAGFQGTHGIALDASGKSGYISDGRGNRVAVFDRATRKVTATIATGKNPDGILYEPKTGRVLAFNGGSKDVTVIDTHTNKVVATIALPGRPEFPQADGKGTVFVNLEDTSQIARIDAATAKVTATWPIAPGEEPSGMAIDAAHDRLFSVCSNKKMIVVDATSGKVVATPTIGGGPDAAGFDAAGSVVFSSNGEGTLTILSQKSPNDYETLQTLATKPGARTMAVDRATGKVYLVSADFGPRPASTPENPRPRPAILPHSFVVLVVGR